MLLYQGVKLIVITTITTNVFENKYIEIFNGTGQNVDLSNYQLWKITNGGNWPEYTFNLSGILPHNDVYIVYS